MRIPSWLTAAPPTVAIEMASRRVTVVAVSRAGGRPAVTGQGSEALPAGIKRMATDGSEDAGHLDRQDLDGKPFDSAARDRGRVAEKHGAKPR